MFWHRNSLQTGSSYSTKVSKLGSVEVVLFAILAIREALCIWRTVLNLEPAFPADIYTAKT